MSIEKFFIADLTETPEKLIIGKVVDYDTVIDING